LSSFRFWFLVLGCVAATTAWRMGWLPKGKADPAQANAQADKEGEIDLTAPIQRKLSHRAAAGAGTPKGAATSPAGQTPPAGVQPAPNVAAAPPVQAAEPPAADDEPHIDDAVPA